MAEVAPAGLDGPKVSRGINLVEPLAGFATLAAACFAATWCPDGLGRDLAWFLFIGAWIVLAAFSPSVFPRKGGKSAFVAGGSFLFILLCMTFYLLGGLQEADTQNALSRLWPILLVIPVVILARIVLDRYLTGGGAAALDEQGWFSMGSYKRVQGQRVRRSTMLTLIITAVTGVLAMQNAGIVSRWIVPVPYSGEVQVTDPHDAQYDTPPVKENDVLTRADFARRRLEWSNKVLIGGQEVVVTLDGKEVTFRPGTVVDILLVKRAENALKDLRKEGENQDLKSSKLVGPDVTNVDQFGLMVLPGDQLKIVALSALGFFLVWRLVNVPAFADFLIATDSEMSKVSWPPVKKLWRDTMVVVVGMFLMGGMIMAIDWVWRGALTSISVLQFPTTTDDKNRSEDLKPWPSREIAASATSKSAGQP